ncbi:MAG: hypothetical protein IJI10_03365 [Eubacterium sp.]|nr:hypothetical protein [Eubacterium sp.]
MHRIKLYEFRMDGASLGGIFVDKGWGYAPLWVMNLILAGIAATASYAIREPGKK